MKQKPKVDGRPICRQCWKRTGKAIGMGLGIALQEVYASS